MSTERPVSSRDEGDARRWLYLRHHVSLTILLSTVAVLIALTFTFALIGPGSDHGHPHSQPAGSRIPVTETAAWQALGSQEENDAINPPDHGPGYQPYTSWHTFPPGHGAVLSDPVTISAPGDYSLVWHMPPGWTSEPPAGCKQCAGGMGTILPSDRYSYLVSVGPTFQTAKTITTSSGVDFIATLHVSRVSSVYPNFDVWIWW